MSDNVRETVDQGLTLPEQDLRIPVKHALVDQRTNLRELCEEEDVSYNAASKALSGHHEVASVYVERLFQRLLHRWKPGAFAPAEEQEDLLEGFSEHIKEMDEKIEEAEA